MTIDNIVFSDEIGAACLTVALLPYMGDQIMKDRKLDNIQDVAVVLYLDLVGRFSRVTSTDKVNN